jgi:hypothetical protein
MRPRCFFVCIQVTREPGFEDIEGQRSCQAAFQASTALFSSLGIFLATYALKSCFISAMSDKPEAFAALKTRRLIALEPFSHSIVAKETPTLPGHSRIHWTTSYPENRETKCVLTEWSYIPPMLLSQAAKSGPRNGGAGPYVLGCLHTGNVWTLTRGSTWRDTAGQEIRIRRSYPRGSSRSVPSSWISFGRSDIF